MNTKSHKQDLHFTRRDFLTYSAAIAGAGVAATRSLAAEAESALHGKPNIVLIMTDQLTASAMSCTGNRYLKTPAMDSLAASGTRFERAYVTQPLCTPCRSSLQTGRYPHEIGTVSNRRKIEGDFPLLGNLMGDAGYECAYIGKWHVGTTFEAAGYAEASEDQPDGKKTEAALAFLQREHDAPFFLTVSYVNPHNVCELARGQELPDGPIPDAPDTLEDLPPLPDNFAVPLNEPSAIRTVQKSIPHHYPTQDWDELKWRQYLWGYYRLVEKVDAEIAQVLAALRDGGYADNTVVLFVADHGEGVAMHHWNQKQILYDEATRVPLILSWPDTIKQQVSAELVSTALDIPATILDFAGAKAPASMRGLSLRPLATGETTTLDREFVAVETMFSRNDTPLGLRGRMIRTKQFKYCVYDAGEDREQLFDMTADRGEMKNLAGVEAYQDKLESAPYAHGAVGQRNRG